MTPLPFSVIGGYLGAGKTTLINRLLAGGHGRRLIVLVNDFGAINVDARLLVSADEDTIALSNGCVCCTIAGSLFQAVGDVLDRPARPDHLVVEASGISDPARIAHLALAEPELDYAGIVTVVDGARIARQMADPRIGAQVRRQVAAADAVALAKVAPDDAAARAVLDTAFAGPVRAADDDMALGALLFGGSLSARTPAPGAAHPDYAQASRADPPGLDRASLAGWLAARPADVLRVKGCVPNGAGGSWLVQVVGRTVTITTAPGDAVPGLVAIALAEDGLAAWWRAMDDADR